MWMLLGCRATVFLFSGFLHSAYTFGLESHVVEAGINGALIPPAALLTLIQKGLHYTEAELLMGDDGTERTLIDSLSLIDAVMPEVLAAKVRQKSAAAAAEQTPSTSSSKQQSPADRKNANASGPTVPENRPLGPVTSMPQLRNSNMTNGDCGGGGGGGPSQLEIPRDKVAYLKGHESEVFICAWNPKSDLLASGYVSPLTSPHSSRNY